MKMSFSSKENKSKVLDLSKLYLRESSKANLLCSGGVIYVYKRRNVMDISLKSIISSEHIKPNLKLNMLKNYIQKIKKERHARRAHKKSKGA